MKILIVTPSYSPIIGGSETLTRTLAHELNEQGIHADVMSLNMNVAWKPKFKNVIEHERTFMVYRVSAVNPFSSLPVNPLGYLRINLMPNPNFLKLFNEYDIIHFLGEADLSLPFFSCLCHRPKIMHCVGVHSLFNYLVNTRARYTRKVFMAIFSRLANLYILSSKEEEKLLLSLGFKQKLQILHYGINTDVFRPNENIKLDNLLLFVGRIEKSKGLHVLLQSLSYLKIKSEVVIIGPVCDRDYFEKIKRMWQQINRDSFHTVMYLGQMQKDALIPWYQKATLLIRPDLIPVSGGLTAMEALACGTPVIGTGNHVVIDGINGIIVLPNNAENLAEAMHKLLTDQELRIRYGREARKTMEQRFNWKIYLTKLIKLYGNLLANRQQEKDL